MSDVMLFGVLRMPLELAMSDYLSRFQFYQRAQQALDRIEQLERQNGELMGANARYEKVRLLNPRMFTEVRRKNITGGVPFDDLIDALEPDLSNFDDVMASSTGAVGATGQDDALNQGGEG